MKAVSKNITTIKVFTTQRLLIICG